MVENHRPQRPLFLLDRQCKQGFERRVRLRQKLAQQAPMREQSLRGSAIAVGYAFCGKRIQLLLHFARRGW